MRTKTKDDEQYVKCETAAELTRWAVKGGWASLDAFLRDVGLQSATDLIGCWFTVIDGRLYFEE